MQNFKNKLYHHETPPPGEIWENIAEELQNEKVISLYSHRKSKLLFYGVTAAASIVIIFAGSLFFKKNKESNSATNVETKHELLAEKINDSINLNQKILESIIHNPREKKEIISKELSENKTKKYLTVANPEGQPVKISPKVATLIISADHEFPPKPVWNKKIDKWQKIMLATTISPTSISLIDLVQLAANNENVE
ncbi:MAG TPA: hypothetical protein VFU62_06205 [Hanamia sp.]|jgi:hypothetical protein|nr:hypothetical protein [Hanamia sp.]